MNIAYINSADLWSTSAASSTIDYVLRKLAGSTEETLGLLKIVSLLYN